MEELIPHGIVNSITQVILKNTVPGVSDTYQGTETWNLSFVDPDNRGKVNYLELSENLEEIENEFTTDPQSFAENLFGNPIDGRLKQWVTWLTLKERLQFPELFHMGNYIPLKVIGKYHKRVIAFCRSYQAQHMVVILPLSTATLEGDYLWEDTRIRLPEDIPSTMNNLLTNSQVETTKILHLEEIFDIIPFAILRNNAV
jgi:(1->4)-alpha-D-glucan 1-alpha-D-glucosylmutase